MSNVHPASYGASMKLLRPAPNVLGFYDGREGAKRLYADTPNWLDDGAYSLGVCTYAVVDGADALVYDTHISLRHAALIRQWLTDLGVTRIRVALSHWHADHIAGNGAFTDCEIIGHALTKLALEAHRLELETGFPPIQPLVLPTRVYEDRLPLTVGEVPVELRHVDCHSQDGTVLFMPGTGVLLAGDTIEDTATYIVEPDRLVEHLRELERMTAWPVASILPNHGDPDIIASGGYARSLIDATHRYVEKLLLCRRQPDLTLLSLREFVADDIAAGHLTYFEPYEAVHRRNVERVCASRRET